MKEKIYAVRHRSHLGLGNLEGFLAEKKLDYEYLDVFRKTVFPQKDEIKALIILGGGMSVNETKKYPFLKKEIKFIENTLLSKIPVLGICLGSQLMAFCLGSKVYRCESFEIGWHKLFLTKEGRKDKVLNFINNKKFMHWHQDGFDIPKDCVKLAYSKQCHNQAFSYRGVSYGLQFHPELTLKRFNAVMKVPFSTSEKIAISSYGGIKKLRKDTKNSVNKANNYSKLMLLGFLKKNGIL